MPVTTIRPNPQPIAPQPQGGGGDAAKLAAQKAFFALAMGRTAPAAQAEDPAPAVTTPSVNRTAAAGADPPQKILRPGSILDIRV